jgi:hypothetical protein
MLGFKRELEDPRQGYYVSTKAVLPTVRTVYVHQGRHTVA